MMGPPMNLGSKGTSDVIDGAKLRVGVLLAASSASSDKGLLSKSLLVLDGGCCCSGPVSLARLLVEDGGEGRVVTYAVVDTNGLLGANVTAVFKGFVLFKMFGVAGLSPLTTAVAFAPAGIKWISLVPDDLAS